MLPLLVTMAMKTCSSVLRPQFCWQLPCTIKSHPINIIRGLNAKRDATVTPTARAALTFPSSRLCTDEGVALVTDRPTIFISPWPARCLLPRRIKQGLVKLQAALFLRYTSDGMVSSERRLQTKMLRSISFSLAHGDEVGDVGDHGMAGKVCDAYGRPLDVCVSSAPERSRLLLPFGPAPRPR
ncbi:hypothetical protein LZ30DRAFT_477848 [Colletotrichum cereale]|nr:hypothetical protein LZ30DRAFT_477848 [Colletotrichum cereale]